MIKINPIFVVAMFLLAQAACAAPTYEPAPNEALAKVNMVGMLDYGQPLICKAGKKYSPPNFAVAPDRRISGVSFDVPVGDMIEISFPMRVGNGYCTSRLSFYPKAGMTYLANTALVGQGCFIELVREDKKSATGLSLELSLSGAICEQ